MAEKGAQVAVLECWAAQVSEVPVSTIPSHPADGLPIMITAWKIYAKGSATPLFYFLAVSPIFY